MGDARLHGRATSHFARVVRIVAHEVAVPIELVHVEDLLSHDASAYGGHPALKVPCLHLGERVVFGAENAARCLARTSVHGARIAWPEEIDHDLVRNGQELVWTAMGLEVQVVLGALTGTEGASIDKARVALSSVLDWLDRELDAVLALLPPARETSLFEITLLCLVEHVVFRRTASLEGRTRLVAFVDTFGARASSMATRPR